MATESPSLEEKRLFGLGAGLLYLLFGVLQTGACLDLLDHVLLLPDFMGICVLFVLAAVFLSGYRELSQGSHEGAAHVNVGVALSLLFALVYLLIMGANSLEAHLLQHEDFQDWTPLDDLQPSLYLALMSLLAFWRWRKEFIPGEESTGKKRKEGAREKQEETA